MTIFVTERRQSLEQAIEEIKQRVMGYAEDITNGDIRAGKKVKQAMKRFYNDIEDGRWYIDWEEVFKVDRWAKMMKHRKGVLAGQPIELTDFQLWLVTNILGFKRVKDDLRKHRIIYIQLARKNAKSQLISILTSYIAFLSPEQEEIYITAWSQDQSNLVYDEALAQIRGVDILKGRFKDSYNRITINSTGSFIRPLSREARKTGEGTNPSVAILDEYKDNKTTELREVQETGMIARAQPLLIFITTAGPELSYPAYSDYQYYARILDPEQDAENDEIFIAIYELDEGDDVKDEENWIKANPIVATYEQGMESLRSELKLALDQPEKMRGFLTKNMNLWIDRPQDGYMELKRWNLMSRTTEEVDRFFEQANCFVGIDASMTTDLTSVALVGVKDGKYAVRQHTFIPSDKFRERMSRDNVRYDLFEQQGFLTQTTGSIVDYEYMKEKIREWSSKYNVKEVAYDKWNLTHFAQDMEKEGHNMIEIPQTINQLSHPTKQFRADVYEERIINEDDPLLRWAISNAVLRSDAQENIMLDKRTSTDRIDPLAAVINAYSRAIGDPYALDLNSYIMSDDFSF